MPNPPQTPRPAGLDKLLAYVADRMPEDAPTDPALAEAADAVQEAMRNDDRMPFLDREAAEIIARTVLATAHARMALAMWRSFLPLGTPVTVWPGVREGDGIQTVTRSAVWRMAAGDLVVMVEGKADFLAVTHVEKRGTIAAPPTVDDRPRVGVETSSLHPDVVGSDLGYLLGQHPGIDLESVRITAVESDDSVARIEARVGQPTANAQANGGVS